MLFGILGTARRTSFVAEYLNEWLEIKRKTCKESTCKEYERLSSTNLLPVFGERPIADITRQELQGYLFRFIDEGKHRTAEKLYQSLCCIFDLACEDLHILSPMKKSFFLTTSNLSTSAKKTCSNSLSV